MDGIVHVAAFYRVEMNVFDLLPHDFVVADLLRMAAFFPKLVLAFHFVVTLKRFQLP